MKAIVFYDEIYTPFTYNSDAPDSEWPHEYTQLHRDYGREYDIPRDKWDHIQYVYQQLEGVNRYLESLMTARRGTATETFPEQEQAA